MNCKDITKRIEWDNLVHKIKWNIQWVNLSKQKDLDIDFIRTYKDKLKWTVLIQNHKFTEAELDEFKDYIKLTDIIYYQHISVDFLEKILNKIFINDNDINIKCNSYFWQFVSYKVKLTEEFIIKYKDYLDWESIAQFQNLSEEFILKMKKYIYKSRCFLNYNNKNYKRYSKEFLEKLDAL